MTVDVADGYVAKTLTAAYAQYQTTSSSAVPVVGFKIATIGDVIDVDFNTLEAAAFANPTPIPVNVSKAADVLTYTSSGNAGAVGTLYAEFVSADLSASDFPLGIGLYTDSSNYLKMGKTSTAVTWMQGLQGGSVQFNFGSVNNSAAKGTAPGKNALAWGAAGVTGVSNGGTPSTNGAITVPSFTNIAVGSASIGDLSLFGIIPNARIYPLALSAAQLQALTS